MRRLLRHSALAFAFIFVAFGCSSSTKHADGSQSTSTAGGADSASTTSVSGTGAVPPGSSPAASPRAALTALLDAEQHLDHATSFRYVLHGADQPYKTVNAWSKRRAELPSVTGFTVESGTGPQVSAVVEHKPGLDPFIGLSPARDRQVWTGVHTTGGWLLQPEPVATPELPPDSAALAVATSWVTAVQRCDRKAASKLQAVPTLFDSETQTTDLCHSPGSVRVGAVGRLAPGPASGDIIAQYTTDALFWARVVPVEMPHRFAVVLAPIGATWKILGITDHS